MYDGGYYPHLFLKKSGDIVIASVRPSVRSPISSQTVHRISTKFGIHLPYIMSECNVTFIFGPDPQGPRGGVKRSNFRTSKSIISHNFITVSHTYINFQMVMYLIELHILRGLFPRSRSPLQVKGQIRNFVIISLLSITLA